MRCTRSCRTDGGSTLPAPRARCANLFRLGVWRSLVARSVRVGEVPSSNLGTPIARGGTWFPRPLLRCGSFGTKPARFECAVSAMLSLWTTKTARDERGHAHRQPRDGGRSPRPRRREEGGDLPPGGRAGRSGGRSRLRPDRGLEPAGGGVRGAARGGGPCRGG